MYNLLEIICEGGRGVKKIVLASASPRRIELIKIIAPDCGYAVADVEENVPAGMPAEECPRYLAELKAKAVAPRFPDAAVIGCDTVVIIDGKLLGKPRDEADAAEMLRELSGRTHTVITGVFVAFDGSGFGFSERTDVEFRALREQEIADYVATGEPMDKAGAYGIQGVGATLVRRINGDFYNVMGLPVARLKEELFNEHIISR
ncbi:MAG: septum formation protein Maf [Clostridia bacterium]|nr:septum formation protein Maf [Clostridia bacterium]MBR5768987.1 septum formation protein Maf [Clostridia bacterium]MBR5942105.1 septum formation protein Maf [Clostridia bacterium]